VCSECGAVPQALHMRASDSVSVTDSVTATLATYSEACLATAERLVSAGDYGIAVVVVHMACEIAVERGLSAAFSARGIGDLEESIDELLPGYNLANPRVLRLFTALTGRDVQHQPFWQAFKEPAKRRNEVVHRGRIMKKPDADASVQTARQLVTFVMAHE
jgi:hypothetical protein